MASEQPSATAETPAYLVNAADVAASLGVDPGRGLEPGEVETRQAR